MSRTPNGEVEHPTTYPATSPPGSVTGCQYYRCSCFETATVLDFDPIACSTLIPVLEFHGQSTALADKGKEI